MKPPREHERFFFTERQLGAHAVIARGLPRPIPFCMPVMDAYIAASRIWDGVREMRCDVIARVDPLNATLVPAAISGLAHDLVVGRRSEVVGVPLIPAQRWEEAWVFDLRRWGGEVRAWHGPRPDTWFHTIRFIVDDIETPPVVLWMCRELERLGAEPLDPWLLEALDTPGSGGLGPFGRI